KVDRDSTGHFFLFVNPNTIGCDSVLKGLNYAFPQATCIGGLASPSHPATHNSLFLEDQLMRAGVVGLHISSSGDSHHFICPGYRRVGNMGRITKAREAWVEEINHHPALDYLCDSFDQLRSQENHIQEVSLQAGLLNDSNQSVPRETDFRIRTINQINSVRGSFHLTGEFREGQQIQFMLDAPSATFLEMRKKGSQFEKRFASSHGIFCVSSVAQGVQKQFRELFHPGLCQGPSVCGFMGHGEIATFAGESHLYQLTSAISCFQ
ncbi:MAG: hypothetical protein F6K07_32855, partial [Okeania sp. SIO1H5]|uniref:FIST N-terminal domain-containing protein n=1 Tax=Okeania sp. SIO1H5 TaxID=2607777 RepID=UPI0013BB17E5